MEKRKQMKRQTPASHLSVAVQEWFIVLPREREGGREKRQTEEKEREEGREDSQGSVCQYLSLWDYDG